MGKMWLKSVGPDRQCCGCEGKSSPCDSCCVSTVVPQNDFSIRDEKFFSRIDDNIEYSDFSLNWVASLIPDSNETIHPRSLLILAKKNQVFDFEFDSPFEPFNVFNYSFPLNTIENPGGYGNFTITKGFSYSKDSAELSANNKNILDSFDIISLNSVDFSLTERKASFLYPWTPFYITDSQDKTSSLFTLSSILEQTSQPVYTNAFTTAQRWYGRELGFGPFFPPTFSSSDFAEGDTWINPTPPGGQIGELLVTTRTVINIPSDPFIGFVTNTIIPQSEWETSSRLPVGIRRVRETAFSPLGQELPYIKEEYLQFINPTLAEAPNPLFKLRATAKKNSCFYISFSNRLVNQFFLSSEEKINFQKLKLKT